MKYLHDLWLSQSTQRPDHVAVKDDTGEYTYLTLVEKSHAWSLYLSDLGALVGDRVLLITESSFESIALLLGCSILGLTFSVISPDSPKNKINAIVADLDPILLIVDGLKSEYKHPFFKDDISNRFWIKKICSKSKITKFISANPAYIVFTSGSTGKPKGIVMSHQAIISFWLGLINHFKLGVNKRYASLSPLQFDFALLDIGLCLGSGATLILPNRGLLYKPAKMIERLAEWKITHFSGVPTIWKMILQSAQNDISKLSSLERIIFAGENFPINNMRAICNILPNIEFYNIYGQSESIACTFHVIDANEIFLEKPHLPVGHGHPDIDMLIIDDYGNQIKEPKTTGELYIRGTPLFSGYWKSTEETDRCLIQNPIHSLYCDMVFRTGDMCYFDEVGLYYFVGRKDNQIKINGNRVELEEIESVINKFPRVKNSCAFVISDGDEHSLHVALVVDSLPHEDKDSEGLSLIREFMASNLPVYMLPRHYHFLNSIPISSNGKNDRGKIIKRFYKNYDQ